MINGKFVIPPNLSDALQFFGRDLMAQLRVALPGQILTYDPAARTCTVQVSYNRVYNDGRIVNINAPLVDVPVTTIQGGGLHVSFPIQAGDSCWVFFADINLDAWHAGDGGPATPLDRRRHDIADGFALVGPNPIGMPIETWLDSGEGGLGGPSTKIAINRTTGKVSIEAGGQSLYTTLTALLNALTALNTAIASESGVIPTAASAATTANVQIALVQTQLDALLY